MVSKIKRALKYDAGFVFMLSVIVGVSSNNLAAESKIPEPFQGEDNTSPYTISYDDYTSLLNLIVLDTGRSFRESASRTKAKTGTRLKSRRSIYTALEGNRINFAEIEKDNNLAVISDIRKSLERVPEEVPLAQFSSQEQLAYWLNLYNITVIEQVAQLYPRKKIEDELYDDDDGVMYQKLLTVSGIPLSLNDIHHNIILEKFGYNPLVMYGLFQGVIGGPNIRTAAYTGSEVFRQLQDNAEEFINSNRGTFEEDRGVMRISEFYETNRRLFGNFDVDLRRHLALYANSEYAYALDNAERFKANISDMSISDIMGSERVFGGSLADNTAALLSIEPSKTANEGRGGTGFSAANFGELAEYLSGKTKYTGRYSPDVLEMLDNMNRRAKAREGTVSVKEEKAEKGESEKN
jgi:hypothetical protein